MDECEHEWVEYTTLDEWDHPYYRGFYCGLCGTEGYAAPYGTCVQTA